MIPLDKFKVEIIKEEENFSKIEIGPFPSGFGQTIGTSLRRILLSSIEGSAVIGIKMHGVKHEYDSLSGIKDDILKILLQTKKLALISHSDEIQVLKLDIKGAKGKAKIVKAKNIDLTGEVEIKNPNLEITSLADEKARLRMEIYVGRGTGYTFPDDSMRKEIGVIPIDSNYCPVRHVQMKVLPARVGQKTDLDKISLEIHTNGTIMGVDALLKASEIYDEIANRLVDMLGGDSIAAKEELEQETEKEEEVIEKILVADLSLSTRLTNSLLNSGITDLNELSEKSIDEVLNFRGMGKKSLDELVEIMQEYGLNLI